MSSTEYSLCCIVEVIGTDEFKTWYEDLTDDEVDDVDYVVELLQSEGLQLGFPHSSSIHGAKLAIRELRPTQGRSPLRVFYAFAPKREAALLVGGDKGRNARFYEQMIPAAEKIFREYLAEQLVGKHDEMEG
jgi:hypothetical protein